MSALKTEVTALERKVNSLEEQEKRRLKVAPKESAATFDPDSDEPCVVTLSTSGNLGRAPAEGARV